MYPSLLPWKKVDQIWAVAVIFKLAALFKLSPHRRKFAQSGHPGEKLTSLSLQLN
jgi:hypothetical protein